jgi:hypothetical protein
MRSLGVEIPGISINMRFLVHMAGTSLISGSHLSPSLGAKEGRGGFFAHFAPEMKLFFDDIFSKNAAQKVPTGETFLHSCKHAVKISLVRKRGVHEDEISISSFAEIARMISFQLLIFISPQSTVLES